MAFRVGEFGTVFEVLENLEKGLAEAGNFAYAAFESGDCDFLILVGKGEARKFVRWVAQDIGQAAKHSDEQKKLLDEPATTSKKLVN